MRADRSKIDLKLKLKYEQIIFYVFLAAEEKGWGLRSPAPAPMARLLTEPGWTTVRVYEMYTKCEHTLTSEPAI